MNRTTFIVLVLSLSAILSCGSNDLGPAAMTEEGFFYSGSTGLSYAFDIPVEGSAPFPLVVFGHDSGANTKNENKDYARRLVENEIAVLRFDKRGVGDSEGVYQRGFADFELLSGDLVSAVDFVVADSRIDPSRIGLLGSSQAGWIIPMVATRSEHVSFVAILSGPAVTVAQHNYWVEIAEQENLSISELSNQLAEFQIPGGDFDPRPFIEEMTVPGLWLLGDKDRIIPARESAHIVEDIANELGKDFTVIIYPNTGHGLRDVESGDRINFWNDLTPWLDSKIH